MSHCDTSFVVPLPVSIVPNCINLTFLYLSFIFPCLGSNGPVGLIYLPHLCVMDKRCMKQHPRVSAKYLTLSFSYCSNAGTKCLPFSHFLEDILLKAENRPILAMMTLRPNSLAVGRDFCRQFWVNSNKINKIFRFQVFLSCLDSLSTDIFSCSYTWPSYEAGWP